LRWIAQTEQRGTGHAVRMALDEIAQAELVLILYGDTPLVRAETLQRLLDAARHNGFALLTAVADNPFGYGRIVRDAAGEMTAIVEEKDASDAERAIREINTGMMAVKSEYLARYLPQLQDDNAAGEFYLTDVIALHVAAGWRVVTVPATDTAETLGINTRAQQAQAEAVWRQRQAQALQPGQGDGVALDDLEQATQNRLAQVGVRGRAGGDGIDELLRGGAYREVEVCQDCRDEDLPAAGQRPAAHPSHGDAGVRCDEPAGGVRQLRGRARRPALRSDRGLAETGGGVPHQLLLRP